MMLNKLISRTNRKRFEVAVISLMDEGVIGKKIRAQGVPLYCVNMWRGWPDPVSACKLIRRVNRIGPDLIQGWMYHGNLAAQMTHVFLKKPCPVLWNIRHSVFDLADEKWKTALVIRLCARMSKKPAQILYNSRVSSIQHERLGYCSRKTLVIPNGFDTNEFFPSAQARAEIRKELGLSSSTPLIGLIARYHPMKDHANFLRAAAQLSALRPEVHFLLAGNKVDEENSDLMDWVRRLKLESKVHLLGYRKDVSRVTAALDIASISSFHGEGFPNVVGEAMAGGIPCVVTDVGDSAWVVGDVGKVVPPKDPGAMAAAWMEFLTMEKKDRDRLGEAGRKRIENNFGLSTIVSQYENVYEKVLACSDEN